MKKDPQDIIMRPLLTEKGTRIQETTNQYFFEVRKDANKLEVKSAVEKLFGVHVVKVNTLTMPGKWTRYGRWMSKSKGWKKAVVVLREGDAIELFEGV